MITQLSLGVKDFLYFLTTLIYAAFRFPGSSPRRSVFPLQDPAVCLSFPVITGRDLKCPPIFFFSISLINYSVLLALKVTASQEISHDSFNTNRDLVIVMPKFPIWLIPSISNSPQ